MEVSDIIKLPERRTCTRCGFVASQEICKACVLLEGLNTGNPKLGIGKSNKAKRIMGLKIEDGSENKTKTRAEKGTSKKKLRREEKRQKQLSMCGGNGGCGSGCGSQALPDPEESSPTFEPVCQPDHEKISVTILAEWLGINFDKLTAFKKLEDFSDDEEEICDDDCPSKILAEEKKLDEEDTMNIDSDIPISNCSSHCENSDNVSCAGSNSKICCSVPPVTSVSDDSQTSDADTKKSKKIKTCNCPLELLENPNHPEVLIDAEEENFGFDIHVFKSMMIAKHPEILDELRKIEEESEEELKSTSAVPSSSKSSKKSEPTESESKNKDNNIPELTSKFEESVNLETKNQSSNKKQLPSSTNNVIESTQSQEQPLEPAVIKANPTRKGASLITPEMMHKTPNTLDF